MALTPGTRLGVYEITAQIGEGGMGQVYRATDTKLKRQVAIKILPPALAADADRLARFQREAEVLASLNHPNIAAIYGLEDADGVTALVMELVEGPTLADRIARTEGRRGGSSDPPIPIDEALPIARQIADALEAAHEQGIIHRDLKPANIKVRLDGVVKVLDFGLAKALESASALRASAGQAPSQAPTITTPAMTQAGMILGTAAYMSPEQARGKTVDKRTDIWAFGCVLYEMLTGQRAFGGDDVTVTLARVVEREPDFDALSPSVPSRVSQVLRVCLRKDAKQRASDIRDVRLALEGAFETTASQGAGAVAVARPVWRRALPYAVGAVVASLVVGFAAWSLRPFAEPRPVRRFEHVIPEFEGLRFLQRVAVSPDGRHIVYSAAGGLYLRTLDELGARLLIPGNSSGVNNPVFSPDGESVVYGLGTPELRRIAIGGGAPVVVATEVPTPAYGASWGGDDTILGSGNAGIWRVPATGGTLEVVIPAEKGETMGSPRLLPDGESVLFSVTTAIGIPRWDQARIVAQSLRTGERTVLVQGGSDARYLPTGHLVYARGNDLLAVPFDVGRLAVTGGPVLVVRGVRRSVAPNLWSDTANYGVSDEGMLVYFPGSEIATQAVRLVWVTPGGERDALDLPAGQYSTPRLSPDGRWLAVERQDGAGTDIWLYETSGATALRRLTEGGNNRYPAWSRDGQRVAFQSSREGDAGIFWQRVDGTGSVERLTRPEGRAAHIPEDWSPTEDRLAFSVVAVDRTELWMWTLAGRRAERFGTLESGVGAFNAVFSPDGQWIAYTERPRGVGRVYVSAVSSPGNRYQLGQDADLNHHPLWTPDGTRLVYFRGADAAVQAADVRMQPTFGFGRPTALPGSGLPANVSPTSPLNHDVGPDGRFVALMTGNESVSSSAGSIVIVEGWFEELKRLVPTK